MMISITGIYFRYDNGFGEEATSVDLSYVTQGFKVEFNSSVTITVEQYFGTMGNSNKLRGLIVDVNLQDFQEYIAELQLYKDGLNL